MKKLLLMLAMILVTGMAAFTQSFEKGNQGINVGLGLGPGYNGTGYGFAIGINGSYEYAIVEIPMGSQLTGVIGVGGLVGFSMSTYPSGVVDYRSSNILIAARGSYHFIFHDKFDPYAGITLGYQMESQKWKGSGAEPPTTHYTYNYFRAGFYVGARYYFTDSFGVYAELGYLLNFFNMGVTFKIQ